MLLALPRFYLAFKTGNHKQLNSCHKRLDVMILKIKGWGLFVVMEGQISYQSLLQNKL